MGLFIILLYLCGIFIFHVLLRQEIRSAGTRITNCRRALAQLPPMKAGYRTELIAGRDVLEGKVRELEESLYPEKTRIYDVGVRIKQIIQGNGNHLLRYTLVEDQEPSYAEFEISGRTPDIMAFLKELSETETSLIVPLFSLKREGGNAESLKGVIRISYEKEQ